MRGIPRPGASDTLEPTMPDVEHVPSDDETSDIPSWGDLFPDDDAAGPDQNGPSVIPKRPRRSHLLVLLILMIFHLWVEELLRSLVFL